jgi:hypothetical protein
VPYLMCPACSLTIPEPPRPFAPRTCARCRLVKRELVRLVQIEQRGEGTVAEPSDEPGQAPTT